ncbi:hypothetical protein [Actinoplanes regularis]|uniref:hypothetical protein n=1 Tax=Actinoplanes regularis TaxID=52697 RepID=UPI0024A4565F|nr:hypothetical protein [Actinoplanes regularis]GLW33075.1 hypothetical protein Areg01_60130 [Actinoplanes regularis]
MSDMPTTTGDLLAALDPLPYQRRMRHLAAWARTAPDRAEVCAELRAGGGYERQLALVAALVVDDRAAIDAATHDPLPNLRSAARTAALRAGRLPGRITELAAADRRRIYRTLRAAPVPALADALLGEVRAHFGDDEAAVLLPACGPSTVRESLPDLAYATRLVTIARRFPDVLADYATGVLAAAPADSLVREWARLAPAVLALAPEQALDLLDRFAPESSLPGFLDDYGPLAKHSPARVTRLLATPGRAGWLRSAKLSPGLLRRLAVLPDHELTPLARRLPSLAPLLRVLPPARRGAIYQAALADVDTERFMPAYDVLELLPAADRAREARRLIGLDRVRRDEEWTLDLSAYLEWPEAAAAQEAALRAGDAGTRARAYTRLTAAAGRSRDPAAVATVITRLTRLRNEQDPVRSAALVALAQVSRLLTAAAAADLTAITTDAVEARDASTGTTAALSRLATDTLRHHVDVPELREWALLTIDLLSTAATTPTLHRFDRVLPRGQETMVFDRLRGWVEAGLARGRYAPLFALTDALGPRAWRLPELQDLLRRAIEGTTPWVATIAISRWLDDPRERDRRVAEVLAADPSAVLLDVVWRTIATRRTDLLDEVLTRRPEGRFADRKAVWTGGRSQRAQRWLPRQQATYVALQERALTDASAPLDQRIAAIHRAAPVGDPGRELVLRHIGAAQVRVAETALAALVHTDRPDLALPHLLAHAGDDRARVAMYSAARAAKYIPPADLVAPFRALLTASEAPSAPRVKVTSRKEAVRILARYGPAASMDLLLTVYSEAGQHRDVRTAVAGAARQRLDADPSWTVLDRAVAGDREERQAVLETWAYAIPARHRPRYATLVTTACRADDREIRRAAFARLHEWSRWAGDVTDLVVDRLTDLDENLASIAVAALLRSGGDTAFDQALTRLAATPEPDVKPGSDLPARRRIELLVQGVSVLARSLPADGDRSVLIAAMRDLAGRPGYRAAALAAMINLGRLDNLIEIADFCAGRPVTAVRTAERVGARLRDDRAFSDPVFLHNIIESLAWRGDLAGGLFATRLVRAGADYGWAGRWHDLVLALRSHPDTDVREDAFSIVMT